jgi:arylsulfatase A-like enzyme
LPSFAGRQFENRTDSGPHGDFIFELDYVVGELLKTVDDLGLTQDTLVILTSDNGPEVPTVYHMRHDYQHDGAYPWRGMKRDNWEGGHRIPLIARWPGKIAAGRLSPELTSLTDIMATLAAIVDFPLPEDAAEDSFNMLPVLLGTESADESVRPYLLMQGFAGQRYLAIRQGPWKYLAHQGSGGNIYENHPLLAEYRLSDNAPDAPAQLFNLAADPGETRNVYFEEPQVAERLQALLDNSKATGRSR